jgi:signal transduction histidine kinase
MPGTRRTTRLHDVWGTLRRWTSATTVAAAATIVLAPVGFALMLRNFDRRFPFDAPTTGETFVWALAAASCLALAVAGVWLWWRVPTTPTGWWLAVAGLLSALWLAGRFWPGPVSPWADRLLPTPVKAAVVLAVLPWPTGRLERSWSRPFTASVVAYVAVGVVSPFLWFRLPSWDSGWVLPTIGDLAGGTVVAVVATTLLRGVAPALLLAALFRRQHALPPSMGTSARTAFVGGAVLATTELLAFVTDVVLPLRSGLGPFLVRDVGTIRSAVEVGRFAVVAGLLVAAEGARRRFAAAALGSRSVEIGAASLDTTAAGDVSRVLGDPTARLRLGDGDAPSLPEPAPGSVRTEIADDTGRVLAAVDHAPDVAVTAASCDALLSAVELVVNRHARRIDADLRTAEVQAIQRQVMDAQDRARRRLERDLHDGVQQRLVALALQASMLARREQSVGRLDEERATLREAIADAVRFARNAPGAGAPAVLDPGLAAGLVALDATIPMATSLHLDGDVPAGHPAASVLWFVASEAVANSLKHAQPTEIGLRLRVHDGTAELTVVDNGVGGAPAPSAILRRLSIVPSTVDVDSPPGRGTTIQVRVDLALAASPA